MSIVRTRAQRLKKSLRDARYRRRVQQRIWRKKAANKRYKAKCVARGDYRKGGRYYREYDPIRDAPRRRRYYLKSKERV